MESIVLYNHIFFTNVRRLLNEKRMTKTELSDRSGISISFLSDLTNGKANPSLKVMQSIAKALNKPLPLLLKSSELNEKEVLTTLNTSKPAKQLPLGYEHVEAILPAYQAFIVKKWAKTARKRRTRKNTEKE